MRKLFALPVALILACTTAPPPAPTPQPEVTTPPPPAVHGFTIEEEAAVLALEDRREFDGALVSQWVAHPNVLHRQRIALALARIGPHGFIDTNGNGERDPNESASGVAELMKLASDGDRNVRETVAFALGEIGDPASIDTLFRLASDAADAGVAAEAVEALAKMARSVPIERFLPATGDSLPEGVRARAIRYLFRWDSDAASARAAELLGSTSTLVRQEAAYALARRAFAPARSQLELLVNDPNMPTRAYAASALGRIAMRESLPALVAMLGDNHPWVRTNAAVAISRLATKDASFIVRDALEQDAARIIAVSEDPDPGTRASSIDALGFYALRSEPAKKRLLEIAASGSRWDRELAAGAIARQFGDAKKSPLDDVLARTSPWGKVRILDASANLKERGPVLRKQFAKDEDVLIRAAAISNIPDGADAEIDVVRAALTDSDVIVRANAIDKYASMKGEPQDKKLATLRAAEKAGQADRDNDARLSAIRGIAAIEFAERESYLRGLVADRDPVVRRVASDLFEEKYKRRLQYTPLPVSRPATDYAAIVAWAREKHTATIQMPRGKIEMVLLSQDAPMTTWNFAQLAAKKYFDNSTFMRVVPNFVIQGGDPRNDMSGGPGYAIRDEMNLQKYTRGAVGMALSGPDTGGSQFFITHSPQPHLDGGYTIFGRVYEGMSGVVDQIERGDRVDTIIIDGRTMADADIGAGARAPLPLELGVLTTERILTTLPEYASRKAEYRPDPDVVEMTASSLKENDRVEVYMGTWCSDSQREVPKFLKIVDELREKYGKTLPVSFVAVDRSKSKPESLLKEKHIEKVATFVYYRGDRELGRIVETPTSPLFEDDLLAIVARN